MLQRIEYLRLLANLREKRPIKLLSGVRGCGKTTLLAQYIDWLKRSGADDRQIIFINMEEPESESLLHYQGLYSYIKKRLCVDRCTYVFIDEIQLCGNFEKAIAGILIKQQPARQGAVVDVYAAASSACIISGVPYTEIRVLPLSFAEHLLFSRARTGTPPPPLAAHALKASVTPGHSDPADARIDRRLPRQKAQMEKYLRREAFNNYASFGGFPFTAALGDDADLVRQCVDGIYNTIVIREVARQNGINNIPLLEVIAEMMARSIGRPLSSKKISAAMNTRERKISCNTAEAYMRALCSAFVFYHIGRYDIKAGKNLKTLGKYYISDTGIRNLRLESTAQNAGARDIPDMNTHLENIVCMELLRRGFQVRIGKYGEDEINFVAFGQTAAHSSGADSDSGGPAYFQVLATIRDQAMYARKFSALERIRDNGPKMILSLDETPFRSSRNGIAHQNLIDWLVGS